MIRSNSNDKELIKSCGVILEAMAQHGEAAELYKMAGQYEKAATMYLRMKAFTKLEGLMDRITSPKLLAQYAKSMESQRRYKDAAAAYERAQDIDNVIRVCLKHLEAPQRAFELVRRTNSVQGASMVATYCMSNGDFELAIEFLLMANLDQQAFDRAKSHSKMDVYARALGDKATEEQYLRVAKFYENSSKKAEAGRYYARCDQHAKAMRLFLQCGEAEIPAAIDVVKQSRESPDSMMLVRMLHDYLVGETDGSPKDPKFIYQLFMAVGNHAQASKTAVVIATSEQEIGGYRTAHSILFETIKELRNNEVPIPNDLSRCLLLLHSYIIVRKLVQRGNHRDAARMLIRVSKNISKFPAHVVPILTSCVIECARGGLKKSAYEHATILMRPEHRPKIMQKVKRTIEKMVRRPPTKEEEEELSPCPFCFFKLPSTLLACPQCKNQLPYCVVTGRHMVASDYTHCPECKSPALYSQMVEIEAKGTPCYMCEKPIDKAKLKKLSREDVKVLLTATPGKKEERKQDSKESKGTVL